MIHIELNMTAQEREEIVILLEEYLSDLKMEIADTEQLDFRAKLKRKRDLVQNFLDGMMKYELAADS